MKDKGLNGNGKGKGTARVLRVKVVNLLYLIFFVLAFLYIPADFVDVFKPIDNSFDAAIDSHAKNGHHDLLRYNQYVFDFLVEHDPDSSRYIADLAKVSKSIAGFVGHLSRYKSRLVSINEGYNDFGYLKNGKAFTLSESFFLKESIADSVHMLLTNYKKLLKGIINKDAYLKIDSLMNDNASVFLSNNEKTEWAKYYFKKMPIAGSYTLLTKFQNDVVNSKNIVLESFVDEMEPVDEKVKMGLYSKMLIDTGFQGIEGGEARFEVKEKEYYRTGEKIDFAIRVHKDDIDAISAYVIKDKRKRPIDFEVSDGILRASFFPYEEGEYSFFFYVGKKTLKKTIHVRETKPLITAFGLNVFYAGIENKVMLWNNNFKAGQLSITISRGEITKNDSVFLLKFRSAGKVDVKVFGQSNGKKTMIYSQEVAILEMPISQPVLNGQNDGRITKERFAKQHGLKLINGFAGPMVVHMVKEFEITRIRAKGPSQPITVKNKGALFSKKSKELIQEANSGDMYLFYNIKLKNEYGRIFDAPSVVMTII